METSRGKLIWSAPARRDLIDIWRYLADVSSARSADEQLRVIDAACKHLPRHPFMGRPRDQLEPGLRSIIAGPYVVFYRVGDAIEIYRVLHGRRDLESIFHRANEPSKQQ